MPKTTTNESRNLLDRIYRIVLIVAAAIIFGVLFYWVSPDLTPYIGETGAALWSWALIILSGIGAHWLLPKKDLAPVSRVLIALLTSAVVATLVAWIAMLGLDFPVDRSQLLDTLALVGLLALAFAGFVFVPIHLLRRKFGRATILAYLLTGTLIPAGVVMLWRPVSQYDLVANLLLAVFLGVIGGFSATSFAVVTGKRPAD